MAITEAETIKILQVLGLPARNDLAFGSIPNSKQLRGTAIVREVLPKMSEEQEAEIRAILARWADVALETDTIQAEGLDQDPARTRKRLRKMMTISIGLPSSNGAPRLERC